MSDFKMVENRKYNDEEIKYVVSRLQANWSAETVAKAFKRDHGEYWANREFTKKQVAYIRSTYKPPPGVVKAYQGPIPEFSRSPTPEDSPDATVPTSRKRKLAGPAANTRSSSIQAPVSKHASSSVAGPSRKQAGPASHTRSSSIHAPVSKHASSSSAGPSRKRQKTQRGRETPTGHGGSNQGQSLASGLQNDPLGSTDDVLGDRLPQEPFHVNANAGDPFTGTNHDFDIFEPDQASRNLSLDPSNSGIMGDGDSPGTMAGGDSPAQYSNIPNLRDLLPDFPLRSIERHQSVATEAGTNATNSALPTPQQQQSSQLGMSNPQGLFPPGCTGTRAVARDDPFGVWYYDPHDTCQIRLGHRHDMDGGVWFTNEMGVVQTLLAMRQTEGIGFILGVATAAEHILNIEGRRYLVNEGDNINPRALMHQVARIVRDNVPDEVLDRERFRVPQVTDIQRLSQMNSRLPAGHYIDPFHNRIVRYDMSGPSGTQGGGHGGGAAGSSRPSRQGTGPPGPGSS